ncbi:polysaccharide biosynthesis tyrosine autokinase [Agromyces atrinae]|uniref:non-specific protein-tyrosine kinase n=1 Tax=Agromyces atrinae TaxID=592376 RepID=A0A4Q2M013_9MICO|nr:polysaccharide biosynthesis tyrosine autokinase [Agromyces atrinae]NYD68421.1 capsular exopolysaccharide synthesis family protein [Agromyces atrinae]RXZ85165.1 polysaccharide biosynthesis tyrosine autokinase [Agromyces atrinae]
MSLNEYLKSVSRRWLMIVLLAALGAAGGYAMAAATPDVYRSTSSVLLTSENGGSAAELVQGTAYIENLVSSYVLLADSELVLDQVIDDLDLDMSTARLAGQITAGSPLNTTVIDLSVVDGTAEGAQRIARSVTTHLSLAVSEVSPTSPDGTPTVRLTTIQSASLPSFPIAPNTRLMVALGAAVGLVLGLVYAIIRGLVSQPITDPREIAHLTDDPVVGEVVLAKRDSTLPARVLIDPQGLEAESLRTLAANLTFLTVDGGLRSFVVTSASPGEAKSSIAASLALTLAESSQRVLLIDADLRRPTIATLTQLDDAVGLTGVLIGQYDLDVAVQRWAHDRLDVLTSGAVPPNPTQLLSSDSMQHLIEQASAEYDVIIIDSPPLLAVTDAAWIGRITDGALVVARYNKTTARALTHLFEKLESAGVRMLGVVISCVPRRTRARYGYVAEYAPKSKEAPRKGAAPRETPAPTSPPAHSKSAAKSPTAESVETAS